MTARELLAAAQAERKAKLDPGRADTVFHVGGRVLLRTKERLDAAGMGKLRPRWDGLFTVTACPSPKAYALALPRRMRCSPTVGQRRPARPLLRAGGGGTGSRAGVRRGAGGRARGGAAAPVRGVTRCLVRWRGHASADDEWLRAEEPARCQEKVAEHGAAAPRRPAARRADPAAAPAAARPAAPAPAPAPLGPPAGFRLAASSEVLSGTALVRVG